MVLCPTFAVAVSITVLADTGSIQQGLPVVRPHPDAARYAELLTRGFSGRLLRLYALEQRLTHPDREPHPAYLVLTHHEGGFPRAGFVLDGRPDAHAAYVDLSEDSPSSGEPGAVDQIFPHELLHIIVRDLAGEEPIGPSRQIHAIGVRTDAVTAFNEGFAEHAQIMAIDDPDAVAATRAIATDGALRARSFARLESYRRALTARWAIAPKAQMTFPFWFSGAEQVLRYAAVKDNQYAFEVDVPSRVYEASDPYGAYLLENVLPGDGRTAKAARRALDTESVVSALFFRLVTNADLQQKYREPAFYTRFAVDRASVDPTQNVYLKLFAAIRDGGYDAAAVMRAYGRLFPDEANTARAVTRATLHGQELPAAPEIWVLNSHFSTGTSIFDQFRSRPRPHSFDLNAASRADLAGVRGMTSAASLAIRERSPYGSIRELARVPAVSPSLMDELERMHAAMQAVRSRTSDEETTLTAWTILAPYVRRAVLLWLMTTIIAAVLHRLGARVSWRRALVNGAGAALVGLIAGWTIDAGNGVLAFATPVVMFGVPGALWARVRRRSAIDAVHVLRAWALAALAAVFVVTPMG